MKDPLYVSVIFSRGYSNYITNTYFLYAIIGGSKNNKHFSAFLMISSNYAKKDLDLSFFCYLRFPKNLKYGFRYFFLFTLHEFENLQTPYLASSSENYKTHSRFRH